MEEAQANQELRPKWMRKFATLIVNRQYSQALKFLDRIIENEMPLFHDLPEVRAERRLAWLCRIDLLRERGRFSEALAWVCLETELNPRNVAAQALKEQLKRRLYFDAKDREKAPSGV